MNKPKTIILTVLTITAVVLATVSIFAYAYGGRATTNTYPNTILSGTNGNYPNGMMGDLSGMSSMMGGYSGSSSAVQSPVTTQNTVLPLVGFVTLIGAAATGISGVAYYLTGFKTRIANHPQKVQVENFPQNVIAPYASVSRTLTSEERKVLDVLVSHNGKYLQKYIRAETGLSRLKIHRIVSRLAERGIVTLKQSGNTNEVHLSSWLQNKPYSKAIDDKRSENQELMVEA